MPDSVYENNPVGLIAPFPWPWRSAVPVAQKNSGFPKAKNAYSVLRLGFAEAWKGRLVALRFLFLRLFGEGLCSQRSFTRFLRTVNGFGQALVFWAATISFGWRAAIQLFEHRPANNFRFVVDKP